MSRRSRWRSRLRQRRAAGAARTIHSPLYVVDSEGPPLVHVSRTRRSEIVIFGREQKLLTPIVLGSGAILLNAAENDEKIEVSKIVPSRFADSDIKVTTTLELADVVRRMANLGASYPEIVTILETASRQRNLPGRLVVDAVPITSPRYLEAVLGKDTTAKKDEALKRASAETRRPRKWSLFGLLNREPDSPAKRTQSPMGASNSASVVSTPPSSAVADPGIAADGTSALDPDKNGDAKKGGGTTGSAAVKRDDSVRKATDDDPVPRRRLLDLFRESDQ